MLKIYRFLGFSYLIAEFVHYYKLHRRYNYFNTLRNESEIDKIKEFNQTIDLKNSRATMLGGFFLYNDDIENFQTTTADVIESNRLKVGNSKLYWRYHPFFMDLTFIALRKIGEIHLRWIGYSKKQYSTIDGYYNIWTRQVKNSKPMLFFPGLGLGAVPYGNILCSFNRTTHMLEVPNLGYATPYSDSQATGKTMYNVLTQHLDCIPTDILAHSMGTTYCAHYVNECVKQNDNTKKRLILFDCFSTKHDILNSHILPFLGYGDYNSFVSIDNSQTKPGRFVYYAMLYFASQPLDVQAFCKRYHSFYNGVFWREYENIKFKYIFSGREIMLDTRYIITQLDKCDYHFIENGQHGSCIFGRKRKLTFDIIKQWFEEEK